MTPGSARLRDGRTAPARTGRADAHPDPAPRGEGRPGDAQTPDEASPHASAPDEPIRGGSATNGAASVGTAANDSPTDENPPDDDLPVERAQVPLPPGAGWPALRTVPAAGGGAADGPQGGTVDPAAGRPHVDADPRAGAAAATDDAPGDASTRSRFAPTADSPPSAPPGVASRRGSGARPAPLPGTARPAPRGARTPSAADELRSLADRPAAPDEDPQSTHTGPTARRALPRTVFHGLQPRTSRARPDQASPSAVPTSVEIDGPGESAARADDARGGAGAAVGLPRMSDDAPARTATGGAHAWRDAPPPGAPPSGRARPGSPGRRRRTTRLLAAAAAFVVVAAVGWTTFASLGSGDDLSSNLGQAPAAPEATEAPAAPEAPGAADSEPDGAAPAPAEEESEEDAEEETELGGADSDADSGVDSDADADGGTEDEPTRAPGDPYAPPGIRRGGGMELRPESRPERLGSSGDLEVGDCLTAAALADRSGMTVVVPCDEPFQVQVVGETTLAGDTWPGETAILRQSAETCSRIVDSEAPPGLADVGEVDVVALPPTAETFADGDRTILCAVTTTSDTEWFDGSLLDEDPAADAGSGPSSDPGAGG
ncbi:septum formation family protein [Georgenia sp. Z1344]|uniref:septum formation family protein n=1 Tax=Georgenia sp. Z1344 TaxID=3416706 RepID=UPI003CEC9682